ncbi:MAG: amino acid ABC transporter permease [Thermoprotei archaeon]
MSFLDRIADLVYSYYPFFLEGLKNTLILTVTAFLMGLILGILIAIGRVYGPKPLRLILAMYVELIRGTPMLLQLFIIYYALPSIGITLDPLLAAFLGMGINSAAYQSEYFRSSIKAVPKGQWEAALSIGMTPWQAVMYIVMPIAMRISLPALTNELVYLLKYSSIAYFLTVVELVYAGKIIGAETFAYLEVYAIIAITYLVISLVITRSMKNLEKRIAIPGLIAPSARM